MRKSVSFLLKAVGLITTSLTLYFIYLAMIPPNTRTFPDFEMIWGVLYISPAVWAICFLARAFVWLAREALFWRLMSFWPPAPDNIRKYKKTAVKVEELIRSKQAIILEIVSAQEKYREQSKDPKKKKMRTISDFRRRIRTHKRKLNRLYRAARRFDYDVNFIYP